MAPEVLLNKGATYVSDFYSLGCLMHLMLTGRSPDYDMDPNENLEKIKARDVSPKGLKLRIPNVSAECLSLLSGLLSPNPHTRLGFKLGAS